SQIIEIESVIHGSYLTGGTVAIAEAGDLGITELKTISENSSDRVLHFSFKLTDPVPRQKTLNFTIKKPQPGATGTNAKPLESVSFEYAVGYTLKSPTITTATPKDNQITVVGTGFANLPPNDKLL